MRVDPALWREERLVKGVMFHTKCEIDRYDCRNAVVAFTTYGESSSRWLASDWQPRQSGAAISKELALIGRDFAWAPEWYGIC